MEFFEKTIEKIPNFLRWTLIAPISILSYWISAILIEKSGELIIFLSRGGWGIGFFTHIIGPLGGGFCAVAAAIMLAPTGKHLCGLIVSGLWCLFFGAAAFFVFRVSSWIDVIPSIVSCVGAYLAFQSLSSAESQHESFEV